MEQHWLSCMIRMGRPPSPHSLLSRRAGESNAQIEVFSQGVTMMAMQVEWEEASSPDLRARAASFWWGRAKAIANCWQ